MSKGISLPVAMICDKFKVCLFRIVLKNIPGSLAKVSTLMAKYNINILSSIIDAPLDKPKAIFMAFVDYSNAKASIEEIVYKLRGLDVVLEVEATEPQLPGLIVNDLGFPLKCLRQNCVLIHINIIGEILRYLYEKFGSAAKVLMYYAGYSSIKDIIKNLRKITGLRGMHLLKACLKMLQAYGYGKFQAKYSRLERMIMVKAVELFECMPFKGKLEEPNSHIFRGILAGIIEEILREEIEVVETKCIAQGDPYCLFVARPRKY